MRRSTTHFGGWCALVTHDFTAWSDLSWEPVDTLRYRRKARRPLNSGEPPEGSRVMADAPDDNKTPTMLQELGLLSIQETARLLEVNANSVYKLITSGKLASLRHGGKSWIEPAEIVDYFARERAEASKLRAQRAKKPGRIRRLNGVK